jgi:hypothetical protein
VTTKKVTISIVNETKERERKEGKTSTLSQAERGQAEEKGEVAKAKTEDR